MTTPELDEDGYPTEETLKTISEWDFKDGYTNLMDYVSAVWHWPDFVTCTNVLNYFNQPVYRYKLITGGWSGNEDIIGALEKNFIFYGMCWQESHRGGKHIFEIKKEPTMTTIEIELKD